MSDQEWNEGHDHEALHVCFILQGLLQEHVIDTPTCDKYPDVKASAEDIAERLADLYQLIGRKWEPLE